MRVRFCESTNDINLFLSRAEVEHIRRTKFGAYVLNAQCGQREFYLIVTRSKIPYMQVKEPRMGLNTWWITISDQAHTDLNRQGRCGTRWGNSYKATVHIGESD
jgi:hypothetical protein